MAIRKVGDRVFVAPLGLGSINMGGTITQVHEIPGNAEYAEYSVEWDDGQYADEIWSEQDFEQDADA